MKTHEITNTKTPSKNYANTQAHSCRCQFLSANINRNLIERLSCAGLGIRGLLHPKYIFFLNHRNELPKIDLGLLHLCTSTPPPPLCKKY